MNIENNHITLPTWLDDLIFKELGAKYCRSNTDMTVIDWDRRDVLNYLGTYFPRSYAEAICIFNSCFEKHNFNFENKEEISIFDFGCGTGGEIIGLLMVLTAKFEKIKNINVFAFDGNQHALRLYEKVLRKLKKYVQVTIESKLIPYSLDDFYDLSILDSVISEQFDIVISFKAICEFVTKQQFELNNPYKHITETFLPKLKNEGIMLLVDVTSFNNISQEWLPQMMDKGLNSINCKIIKKNNGYNQSYFVSHSMKCNDVSKIAWRLIKK